MRYPSLCSVAVLFLASLVSLLPANASAAAVKWKRRQFPNPELDAAVCRSPRRICDPDSILNERELSELTDVIQQFEDSHAAEAPSCPHGTKSSRKLNSMQQTNQQEDSQHPVQVAVALVEQMDLSEFYRAKEPEEAAAESFAVHLHNQWGVGSESSCGGTGILLFLSMGDRVVYISRGSAFDRILTDARLDRVIDRMRPLLRAAKFGPALAQAIHEIAQHLESGEPQCYERWLEHAEHMLPWAMFASIFGLILYADRVQRRQERVQRRQEQDYVRVQTQLSELDRARAEALQGRYQCTSCPICLSEFPTTPSSTGRQETSSTTPSNDDSSATDTQQYRAELPKQGSDGLPLRLLRCGHVFDETCWNEWVESGRGNVGRCPICQQDVGAPSTTERIDTSNSLANERMMATEGNEEGLIRQRRRQEQTAVDRAIRQYQRERAFRLAQLSLRYPRYVRQDQIQRWTQSTYDGSLARDPSFVRSKPERNNSGGSSRGRSGGGGFGGGRSSGGRSGRW